MLELKKITKIYETGDLKQRALDEVNLNFRKSEFASILGPSGSGKTTLLNIIGGLDKYTSGDLIINEVSTKKYRDADWDSYRNHKIGFVFQSYNLINHQTVLQNVALALTLSGVSKKDRILKAKKILVDVGLEEHINKRPNQLSGGQMQRVAIARALVNDPDILLADEPTGALDSETSVQIMKLLKEISKNKLVVMVTHNPDLANEYSNRIINLIDGKIISDTNPYDLKNKKEKAIYEKTKKTFMSFFTALSLSFNNLMTKKGRTILASFAGSIGIIGIALILSLSTGFQNYIDKIQEDTLSSYPLTITSETADMTSMLLSMVSKNSEKTDSNIVTEKQYVSSMFSNITTNDLKSFKNHIEKNYKSIKNDVSSLKYGYSVDPLIYTRNPEGEVEKVNPNTLFTSMYSSNSLTSMYSSYSSIFTQMIDDKVALEEQYDVLAGRWPKEYNEMILVLSEPNAIPDLLVYFLGLRDIDELNSMITKLMSGESVDTSTEPLSLTYDELMNIEFKLVNPSDTYKYNEKYNIYEDMSEDENFINNIYKKSIDLKIVGVVCAKEGSTSMALSPGIAYTSKLVENEISNASKSPIVKKQLANKKIDVFSNTKFEDEKKKPNLDFEDMISVDTKLLESAFNVKVDEKSIKETTSNYMNEIASSITADASPAYNDFTSSLNTLSTNIFNYYISNPLDTMINPLDPSAKLAIIHTNDVKGIVEKFIDTEDSKKILSTLENKYVIPSNVFKNTYSSLLNGLLNGYIGAYYKLNPSLTTDTNNIAATISNESVDTTIKGFMNQAVIIGTSQTMSQKMTEAKMQKEILSNVGNLTSKLMSSMANAFDVDSNKIAAAFKFDLSEDELNRLMSTMMSSNSTSSAVSNLTTLGYQDLDDPSSIAIYFKSFESKENFIDFIDKYNKQVLKQGEDDKEINYTDITGILMSSVKKVVNSVSYVLIAFVSISLIVSSIMIGIITYISVLERTKEIGILRAIGASKGNISSIFNAETFIVGLLSGIMGVGVTLVLVPIINNIIHSLTGNTNINAILPIYAAIILVILSIILTLIGGLIPSKAASKKDPVIALRTE